MLIVRVNANLKRDMHPSLCSASLSSKKTLAETMGLLCLSEDIGSEGLACPFREGAAGPSLKNSRTISVDQGCNKDPSVESGRGPARSEKGVRDRSVSDIRANSATLG